MADDDNSQNDELAPDDSGPQDESTRQDRALETWGESDLKKSVPPGQEGTLFAIEAHTGQHPMLASDDAEVVEAEPSVTDSLKKAKGMGNQATMYGPTTPGSAKVGSTHATQFGPTNAGNRPASGMIPAPAPHGPGTMHSGSSTGQHPVAPFGGKIVVGTRVGQIEVTGVLGKGGMGEVFRGYHHALDIEVALKVLPDELSRNDLVRQRFLREARLCVKLDHPNIVRVYNVDEHAGNLFLTMDLVAGTDAARMIKTGGRFKYRRALEIGAAGADALAYANTQQGLVHRDVKPHNILLGAHDGKIKLSDFGLARATTSASHLTMSGQIMGTPHYMSPEQAEAKEVNDKSDVYSLGVTLYHMLTGETPFVGDTPISVAV
jgi:predicted Ser/Thr protein kinase